MSVIIRYRTDHRYIAAAKALGRPRWRRASAKEWKATPPAVPGDIWIVQWYGGGHAGYDICCPTCGDVHGWTTARNCGSRRSLGPGKGFTCDHQEARSSCWTWTGTPEGPRPTLTATPSLHSDASIGGCGFHGFLTNGVLA